MEQTIADIDQQLGDVSKEPRTAQTLAALDRLLELRTMLRKRGGSATTPGARE